MDVSACAYRSVEIEWQVDIRGVTDGPERESGDTSSLALAENRSTLHVDRVSNSTELALLCGGDDDRRRAIQALDAPCSTAKRELERRRITYDRGAAGSAHSSWHDDVGYAKPFAEAAGEPGGDAEIRRVAEYRRRCRSRSLLPDTGEHHSEPNSAESRFIDRNRTIAPLKGPAPPPRGKLRIEREGRYDEHRPARCTGPMRV